MTLHHGPSSVRDLCARIAAGQLAPSSVVRQSLARIAQRDSQVHAWVSVARPDELVHESESVARQGKSLAGIPVGVKDVIDVAGFATRCGSRSASVPQANCDATVIAQVRAAGGVVAGKTATAPFAYRVPAETRNPRRLDRSPGGSSSGSAAAVADQMVPLAIGTQTGGSVVRPAAYCGIVGFKPSFGSYSLHGVQPLSPSADTLGLFGRTVDDVRYFDECLSGRPPRAVSRKKELRRIAVPIRWMCALLSPVALEQLIGFIQLARDVGIEVLTHYDFERVTRVALNDCFFRHEASRVLPAWLRERALEADAATTELIASGRVVSAEQLAGSSADLLSAARWCGDLLEAIDVIITAAAPDEPPLFGSLGDSNLLNRAWTILHLPTICVPCGSGPTGLPLGLQVIGRYGGDAALLDAAEVIEALLLSKLPASSACAAE